MILFLSDFGLAGPYVGQVHAVLARWAPGTAVIDLMHDLPPFRPIGAGHLLAALHRSLVARGVDGTVYLAVVDPGVGTDRAPLVVEASGARFVGPDNGLLSAIAAAEGARAWRIDWRPDALSDSFHGRDLFAPVAAMLARGEPVPHTDIALSQLSHADAVASLAEVIYIDRFGNVMSGIDAAELPRDAVLEASGQRFRRARTFGEVPPGTGFWYANSLGLVEIAVNQGSAAALFGLVVGKPVSVAG